MIRAGQWSIPRVEPNWQEVEPSWRQRRRKFQSNYVSQGRRETLCPAEINELLRRWKR